MPSYETVKTCWQTNPDGAGIAYWRSGDTMVSIEKGFMRLKALRNRLAELELGIDDLVIVHYRWATHGLKDQGNCHPFPLTSNIEALRAITGQFPIAIAHNGVFGNMACHKTLSDTQKFIRRILANPAIMGNLDNTAIQELLIGYCGTSSKLAFLSPSKLLLVGHFIKDSVTGLLYSNDGYKEYTPVTYGDNEDYNQGAWSNWGNEKGKPLLSGECELCALIDRAKIEYREEFEMFLCDKCYEFNLSTNVNAG